MLRGLTITKRMLGAARNLLRKLNRSEGEATAAQGWTPVFEESTGRKVSAPMHRLCAVTDIGKVRRCNEDGYFLSRDCKLWIVADGLGGHAAGQLASKLTIETIVGAMEHAGTRSAPVVSHGHSLKEAFADAQARVLRRSERDAECQGMGSTAIAGIVQGEVLHVCHIGDTRCYHFSRGQLRRLTNDHSLVWDLVMAGLLTPDEARTHPQRGIITQAIGMQSAVQPDVTSAGLIRGDRVLLCSDGLWEALEEGVIASIMRSNGSMMDLASMLVDQAKMASGQDNITAVLYEHL